MTLSSASISSLSVPGMLVPSRRRWERQRVAVVTAPIAASPSKRSRLANAPARGRPKAQCTSAGAGTNHIVCTVAYKRNERTLVSAEFVWKDARVRGGGYSRKLDYEQHPPIATRRSHGFRYDRSTE